jgi:hypothetical protein
VHQPVQPVLEKQNQLKILLLLLVKLVMYLTAPIKWITKAWLVSSRVLQHQDLGDASMSSTDSFLQCFLYAQYNSNRLLMLSKLEKLDLTSKVTKLLLIHHAVLLLP